MNYSKCPNCQKAIGGMFGSKIVEQTKTDIINAVRGTNVEAFCTHCIDDVQVLIAIQNKKYYDLQEKILPMINIIPILTSPAPHTWDYNALDMVSSQITSGTSFLTELSRSINDFFGTTSNTTNLKVSNTTELCKTDIRIQCLKLGGNAIISTDIDFNEVGAGVTNMLLVCMAGTAVKVNNLSMFDKAKSEQLEKLAPLIEEFQNVSLFNKKLNAEFNL